MSKQKTLNEWLKFIDHLHLKRIDMSLERVTQVAHNLQLFPFEPFCITVAGTNGKGTTSTLIEQILVNAGYHVGAMSSPHLLRFNERLRMDGKELSDQEICQAFDCVNQARGQITLSYFEFVTLAGFLIFKKSKVNIAVLEVGMGGRLDAVNVIDSNLAIITNVALDHTDFLGKDRESIGREKAGILRPHIPVIYGENDMPNSITEAIKKNHNQLFQLGKDFPIKEMSIHTYLPAENITNAIKAIEIIQDKFPVSLKVINDTVLNFSLPGRWQVIEKPFKHIFDVAHNPHGIAALKKFLQKHACNGKTYAIFSMINTKDIRESLGMIKNEIDYWYIAPVKNYRALTKIELDQVFQELFPHHYTSFSSLTETYEYAKQYITHNDRLVVFGSFHTVAEVWQLIV